jgi:hypothetical protein
MHFVKSVSTPRVHLLECMQTAFKLLGRVSDDTRSDGFGATAVTLP